MAMTSPLSPEDATALRMLAGAHFGPHSSLTLPSGRTLSADEAQALSSAYAPSRDQPAAFAAPVSFLSADPPATKRPPGPSLLLAAAALILGVVIGAGGLALAQHPPSFGGSSAAADQKEILAACHKSVEGRLTSPGSARYSQESVVDKTGTQEKAVSGTVDSQNGFGALIRGAYSCTVEKTQAGVWVVDAYEVHQLS